ncbi:hypothetical protein [Streptomyces subrutilus]|uniref:hypothetical protein n=1 Tax=Streptomyces subrutilus TaxID=36818 RepID=UPI0033E3FB18
MRSTRTAKTANTTAACLVVLAGMFAGTGVAVAATEGAPGTSARAADMPWGIVGPDETTDMPWGAVKPGPSGDMPWGIVGPGETTDMPWGTVKPVDPRRGGSGHPAGPRRHGDRTQDMPWG